MKKKPYTSPKMEVVNYEAETRLLAGSSTEDDDPYWKPPETPAGCQSAWWCG